MLPPVEFEQPQKPRPKESRDHLYFLIAPITEPFGKSNNACISKLLSSSFSL